MDIQNISFKHIRAVKAEFENVSFHDKKNKIIFTIKNSDVLAYANTFDSSKKCWKNKTKNPLYLVCSELKRKYPESFI